MEDRFIDSKRSHVLVDLQGSHWYFCHPFYRFQSQWVRRDARVCVIHQSCCNMVESCDCTGSDGRGVNWELPRSRLANQSIGRLQNWFEVKVQTRVQIKHDIFLNSLLKEEQEMFSAELPEDSGLLPGCTIILFASDLKYTFVLVCMLTQAMLKFPPTSFCWRKEFFVQVTWFKLKAGWAFYTKRKCVVLQTLLHESQVTWHSILSGNLIAGADEYICTLEPRFVLDTPKHLTRHFWKLF